MEDIHKYLDETEKNLKELVSEIERIKNLRTLNEKTTNSLISMQAALDAIKEKIKPFQHVEIKKLIFIFFGISILNSIMLAALLVLPFIK